MTTEMENILIEEMKAEDESIELGLERESLRETIDFIIGLDEEGNVVDESLF